MWQTPPKYLAWLLTMLVTAVTLTVVLALRTEVEARTAVVAAVLIALGVVETELARKVERDRREYNDTPHVNLTAVWTVPGAVVLPPILAAAVVVALYLHLYWRSWYKIRRVPAYRPTLSATVAVLSCYATWTVVHLLAPAGRTNWDQLLLFGVVVAALLVRFTINSLLIGVAINLYESQFDLRRAFGTWRDNTLEFGTLGLGAVSAAGLLIGLAPVWLTLIVPAVLVLHHHVLIRQLEEAAATDAKTGLANNAAWTALATAELSKPAGTETGVLMIDLDDFKSVNDTYGHLAGDQVLEAVAGALTNAVRTGDIVGRWGGEEFTVLCPKVNTEQLVQIGERICRMIRSLEIAVSEPEAVVSGLTVSIGAAVHPRFGPGLREVLQAADDALFIVKDSGKDGVKTPLGESESDLRRRSSGQV